MQTKPCEHHAELLRKIAGLCNNANQLAHVANGTGMAGEASVQEMIRISKETWRLVKEGMVDGIYQRTPRHRLDRSIDYVKIGQRPPRVPAPWKKPLIMR